MSVTTLKPDFTLYPAKPSLDDRPLRHRVGLVVLATDHTTEPDFRRIVANDNIGVYVARIPYSNPTTPENLRKMQPSLTAGAALILPGEELDVICYSCTSASVVIGDAEVASAIELAKPGVPVVTPPLAAVAGLRTLDARHISILTPYTAETSRPMARYFADRGFTLDRLTCLGFDDDREMARISPESLAHLAAEVTASESDALFVSCTALRAALAIRVMETAIGRPVVSSNLATAWQCLRHCGDTSAYPEYGSLMILNAGP